MNSEYEDKATGIKVELLTNTTAIETQSENRSIALGRAVTTGSHNARSVAEDYLAKASRRAIPAVEI